MRRWKGGGGRGGIEYEDGALRALLKTCVLRSFVHAFFPCPREHTDIWKPPPPPEITAVRPATGERISPGNGSFGRVSVCLPACLPHRLVAGQACVLRRRIRFHLDRRLTDTLLPFFYCSEPPSPVWAALGCWATGYWVAGLLGSWDLGRPSFLPPHIHIPPPPLGSSQAVHSVRLSSPVLPSHPSPSSPSSPSVHPSIHPPIRPSTHPSGFASGVFWGRRGGC